MTAAFIAAVWLVARFISPTPDSGATVTSYSAQRGNATVPWSALNLYRSPSNLVAPVPKAPGLMDSVWFSVTQEPYGSLGWRAGGHAARIRYTTSSGRVSPWSNYLICAVTPDTIMVDGCGRRWIKPPGETAAWYGDPPQPSDYYVNEQGNTLPRIRTYIGRSLTGRKWAQRNALSQSLYQVVFYREAGDTLLAGCDQVRAKCAQGFGPIVHAERFMCAKCYENDYWNCFEPTCAELVPCPCGSAVRGGPGPPCP